MQLARNLEHPARQRCPYCHDQLEVDALALIECPGCGTRHHQVCIAELGRCSVMGCERRLEARAAAGAPPPPHDSPIRRLVRQRYQERSRQFVQRYARTPEGLAERVEDALGRAREEEAAGRWRDARETWDEVLRLLERASSGERAGLEALVTRGEATRRRQQADRRWSIPWQQLLTSLLRVLLVMVALAAFALVWALLILSPPG